MKKCEHCSKDCSKRIAVRHKGEILMVGTACSKKFKRARVKDLLNNAKWVKGKIVSNFNFEGKKFNKKYPFATTEDGWNFYEDFPRRWVYDAPEANKWSFYCDLCQEEFKMWYTDDELWKSLPCLMSQGSYLCVKCFKIGINRKKYSESFGRNELGYNFDEYHRAVYSLFLREGNDKSEKWFYDDKKFKVLKDRFKVAMELCIGPFCFHRALKSDFKGKWKWPPKDLKVWHDC